MKFIFDFIEGEHKLIDKGETAIKSGHVLAAETHKVGDNWGISSQVQASMKDKIYDVKVII